MQHGLSSQARGWKKQFFPGALGWAAILTIGCLVGASVLTPAGNPTVGLVSGVVTCAVLMIMKLGAGLAGKKEV